MKDKKKEEEEEEEETGYVHCVYMIMDTSRSFSRIRYTQNVSHNVRKMSLIIGSTLKTTKVYCYTDD